MGLELPRFLPTVMHVGDHRVGKGLTPAQDPTLAPLPSYAGARPLAGFSSGRCCGASVLVRRRGSGRPRALKMLGSVVHPRAGSSCRPRQLVGAAGTLPRRLPLSTRSRTGWQVREGRGGAHPRLVGTRYPGTAGELPAGFSEPFTSPYPARGARSPVGLWLRGSQPSCRAEWSGLRPSPGSDACCFPAFHFFRSV